MYFVKSNMADLSIIEFGVYGFFAYTSMLMLIISVVKAVPDEKSYAIIRAVYLLPGIIASFIIASSEQTIILADVTNTIIDLNTTSVWTEAVFNVIELQNPIWVTFHYLIGIVMIVYVFLQIITLLTKIK